MDVVSVNAEMNTQKPWVAGFPPKRSTCARHRASNTKMTNAQSRDADAAAANRAAKLEVTTTMTFPATLLAALASFGGRPDDELSEDERGILWLARTFKAAVDDVLPRASAVARDTLAVATFVRGSFTWRRTATGRCSASAASACTWRRSPCRRRKSC